MEKYIVIIILVIIGYITYKCLSTTKEGFGDAVTVDAVDDNNAINILGKIAKDIQEGGGLKVKGNLQVGGVSTLPVDLWHASNDGRARLLYYNKGATAFGSGNGYQWRNSNDGIMMALDNGGILSMGVNSDRWHKSLDGIDRFHFANNSNTAFGTGNTFHWHDRGHTRDMMTLTNETLVVHNRNLLAELNALRAELDDVKNNYIRREAPIRLRRTGDDGNEGAYFKGDGWVGTGDGWSTWRIFRT